MEINNNIPNFNFISSIIKEKNNSLKESILLGNIHFPQDIIYTPKNDLFENDNHQIFLNNLSKKLILEKIKEEKQFLSDKIEITDKKIKKIKYKNELPPINLQRILPEKIKIENKKNNKSKDSKDKLKKKILIEIKPLPSKRSNQKLIDKRINKENEYNLEQNAKEFIRKINNFKMNNIALKRQKQNHDLMRLKKEIAYAERRKLIEEYELQKKREERKQRLSKKKIDNNINKMINVKYHYYNSSNSSNKKNKMVKNFSYIINDYNYPFYNNNNNNNFFSNSPYQQMINQEQINNQNIYMNNNPISDRERRNTENPNSIKIENNNSNIGYKESYPSIINDSRSNNNSFLNTSEKKHLYYFNDLKYEN